MYIIGDFNSKLGKLDKDLQWRLKNIDKLQQMIRIEIQNYSQLRSFIISITFYVTERNMAAGIV